MRTKAERGALLPPGWAELLHQGRQALQKTLAELDERERAFSAAQPAPADDARAAIGGGLGACGRRVEQFQAGAREAERAATEIDTSLQETEQAVQAWLGRTAGLQRRVADLEGRAV